MRALLIEDDMTCAYIERRLLESVGFEVEHCSCGLDGVQRAKSAHFDVVVTDMDLPDIQGDEVAMRIRTFQEIGHKTPVYGISANKDNLFKSTEYFVKDCIEKPFSRRVALSIRDSLGGAL